jgi:hypothetical protein
MTDINEREQLLVTNPDILAAVERGLAESAAGDTHDLGDFSQYLND